jgi:hypothetical protein
VDREAAQMTHNNGDIRTEDIIDLSFNLGSLTPYDGKPVLKMKIFQALFRVKNFTVPKGWGWHA